MLKIVESKLDNCKKIYHSENKECYAEIEILKFDNGKVNSFFEGIIDNEVSVIKEFEDIDDMTKEEILNEYKENFIDIYNIRDLIKEDLIIIHYIQNNSEIKGLGKEIVDCLKENYDNIILYSSQEAESYWNSNGFNNCFLDYYFYKNNKGDK